MAEQTMQDPATDGVDEAPPAPLWSLTLKPERVAEGSQKLWTAAERLRAAKIQQRLKRMPGWNLTAYGQALVRERQFVHAADAVDFAAFVLHIANRQQFPAEVFVAGRRVAVALQGHPVDGLKGGVDEKLLNFAASLG
jgi:pterin-4a-carbinolamine dehydratase